jgi:hypothetical protein
MLTTQWLNLKSYILAGRLLHSITFFEILLALLILPEILGLHVHSTIGFILKYYVIVFILSLPIFSQLDARSRYQNYKQIKDQIYIYGWDLRIFNPILKSRCQRDAAMVSAMELGYGKDCQKYFKANGYRWYHLIPDFVFKKPQFLFTKYFWRTTFFTPRYIPKFDYSIENMVHSPTLQIVLEND